MTTWIVAQLNKSSGGRATYVEHLQQGFDDAVVVKLGKTRGSGTFGNSVEYTRLTSLPVESNDLIILAACEQPLGDISQELVDQHPRTIVVHHDPRNVLPKAQRYVSVRPHAQYPSILHPYAPEFAEFPSGVRRGNLCHARVNSDKQTHLVVKAVELGADILITGRSSRLYAHSRGFEFEEFSRDPGSAARLCSAYKYDIDLTVIKGDGFGTQYTSLEAIDGGAIPVLWYEWTQNGCAFECVSVRCAEDLLALPAYDEKLARRNRLLLDYHHPRRVAEMFRRLP